MLDNTAPFVRGSSTSHSAAQLITPHKESIAGRVYEHIVESKGATRYDVARDLELSLNTVNPRLRELEAGGWIRKSATRISEESGSPEWVWVEGQCDVYSPGTTPHACGYKGERKKASGMWQLMIVDILTLSGAQHDDSIWKAAGAIERFRTHLASARRVLVEKGVVMATGSVSPTASGRLATVWMLVPEGATLHVGESTGPRKRSAAPAVDYSPSARYSVGQTVRHATHGTGTVTHVDIDGSGIEVVFECGVRELVAAQPVAA